MNQSLIATSSTAFNGVVKEYVVDQSWESAQTAEYQMYRNKVTEMLADPTNNTPDFPLCLEVETTYHCNLECPFCARGVSADERVEKHISPEVWSNLLGQIEENYLPSLMMDHEGESLLNKNLESMISDARDRGVLDVWLHTNGQALTEDRSRNLLEAGLTKLNVSIDASTSDTYNIMRPGGQGLELVEENLRTFARLKKEMGREDLRLRTSFVVTAMNRHEMESFFSRWKDVVNIVAFQSEIEMAIFDNSDRRRAVIDQAKALGFDINKFTCSHLFLIPVLDVEGRFLPCGMPVREKDSDFQMGNILDKTLKEMWTGTAIEQIRNWHLNHQIPEESICYGCAHAQFMSGR